VICYLGKFGFCIYLFSSDLVFFIICFYVGIYHAATRGYIQFHLLFYLSLLEIGGIVDLVFVFWEDFRKYRRGHHWFGYRWTFIDFISFSFLSTFLLHLSAYYRIGKCLGGLGFARIQRVVCCRGISFFVGYQNLLSCFVFYFFLALLCISG